MRSFLAALLSLAFLMGATNAFAPSRNAGLATQTAFSSMAPAVKPSPTSLNMVFGNRKTTAQKEEEAAKAAMYWEGEWVCADCGYIYNRGECAGMYFEEQGAGFRCPQCSGPRRRYAKKVGDVVGTTLDGGDGPILLFSIGGMIATVAFGIWAVDNL